MNARIIARRQAGFTMVELIVVILILGILAAVAVPRFISMGADARAAKLQAILGSVRSATQIVHSAALVRSLDQQTTASNLTMDSGATVQINYGYPTGTVAGIVSAAGLVAANDGVTLSADAAAGSAYTISINGASGTCQVSYTSPSAVNTAPTITATPASGTTGC